MDSTRNAWCVPMWCTRRIENKTSCECKKVVSDILDVIEFVVDIESTCKMTHFEPWLKSQFKIFTFLWTKQVVKKQWNTKEIWAQNCFAHKMTKMHLRPSCIQPTKSVATDPVVPNVYSGTLCCNCPLVVLQLTPWYGACSNTWHPVLKHLLL